MNIHQVHFTKHTTTKNHTPCPHMPFFKWISVINPRHPGILTICFCTKWSESVEWEIWDLRNQIHFGNKDMKAPNVIFCFNMYVDVLKFLFVRINPCNCSYMLELDYSSKCKASNLWRILTDCAWIAIRKENYKFYANI